MKQLTIFPEPKYKEIDFEEAALIWRQATGTKFAKEGFISAIVGQIVIDVFSIDVSLHRKYNYDKEGLSMNQFIQKQFGEDVFYLFNKFSIIGEEEKPELLYIDYH